MLAIARGEAKPARIHTPTIDRGEAELGAHVPGSSDKPVSGAPLDTPGEIL
jgi:hypothetical protein